jgi:hypothetical protein
MTARDKARPLIAQPHREMRDVEGKHGQENELAAASERFSTTLRAAAGETMKGGARESTSDRIGCEHLLWTAAFESDWHRCIRKAINPSTKCVVAPLHAPCTEPRDPAAFPTEWRRFADHWVVCGN